MMLTAADLAPFIAVVENMNKIEQIAKAANGAGIPLGNEGLDLHHYSVSWDSLSERWTLVAETNEAPDLCPFNQTRDECRELDLCEQCHDVSVRMTQEIDNA